MKRYLIAAALAAVSSFASPPVHAQQVATFDDLPLAPNAYYNGADSAGGFSSGGVFFRNTFDPAYFTWDGFSYSNVNDPDTPGFFNQYAVISGTDVSGAGHYAIGFDGSFGPESDIIDFPTPVQVRGLYLNNSTYAALSMLLGDAFAKQFGGPTGDDPDFFKMTISGKDAGGAPVGSVDVYLADFRFTDNSHDYVMEEWTWVDLTGLGADVSSLHFALSSSDNGPFGMNTPAYYALDNVSYVPQKQWAVRSDLAIKDVALFHVGPWLVVEVKVANLGGRPADGWLVTATQPESSRRQFWRRRHVRSLEPGEESIVRIVPLSPWQLRRGGAFTISTYVIPRQVRNEITLENNFTTTLYGE